MIGSEQTMQVIRKTKLMLMHSSTDNRGSTSYIYCFAAASIDLAHRLFAYCNDVIDTKMQT